MPHPFVMNVRKLAVCLSMFFAVALLTACSQSPESVAYDFVMAGANGQVDKYFEHVTTDDVLKIKRKFSGADETIANRMKSELEKKGGLDSLSTTLVRQTDDSAIVKVVTKYNRDRPSEEYFKLVKESGKWKVKLDV